VKIKKIKLYAIGNEEDFNYYIFDKKEEVIKIINKLFLEVFKTSFHLYEGYEDKRGRWRDKKINFEKRKDFYENVSRKYDGDPRIDMFYGNKKIFITINCSEKERLKFNEKLSKVSAMPKEKKLPKTKMRESLKK